MRRSVTLLTGVVAGVCLGVAGMLATVAVQAQRPVSPLSLQLLNQPEPRLITIPAPRGKARTEMRNGEEVVVFPPAGLVFLKDVQSNGCWLAAFSNNDEIGSLAAAPDEACR